MQGRVVSIVGIVRGVSTRQGSEYRACSVESKYNISLILYL